MVENSNIHVISTPHDTYLVDATTHTTPSEAENAVRDEIDGDTVFYENTLDEYLTDLEKDQPVVGLTF